MEKVFFVNRTVGLLDGCLFQLLPQEHSLSFSFSSKMVELHLRQLLVRFETNHN